MILPEVDHGSGIPIYLQIVGYIRHALEVGSLEAGQRLPTVRALARRLGVAPNTVVRAYGELQREGLIESRPGVGTVVAGDPGSGDRKRRVQEIYRRVEEIVRDAAGLGITEDELWECFEAEFERLRRR
ncbi:GntR family transcriptional regulator [Rubrobacter calidifluminis]|uniref:GntR family transcriptional regulator n=1 Tax=Rubrobacter calidifluminis TaxID=1392640 RepID=UPI002361E035|nr:GntR family transcriptional regulator [Rubrobacter calidifluminis]